jgi:hypothetical protein
MQCEQLFLCEDQGEHMLLQSLQGEPQGNSPPTNMVRDCGTPCKGVVGFKTVARSILDVTLSQ